MRKRSAQGIVIAAIITAVAPGCSPDGGDDGEDPPGILEYEDPSARYYRLDRRVDIVAVDPMLARSGCGFLTDRAYDDLTNTLASLDSGAKYVSPDECTYGPPNGLLYLDGFDHSPFECSWYCCNEDLIWVAIVYWAAASSLSGPDPNINGEIYVAFEPDEPCPD
jgi:hypothetical protein